MEPPGDFGVWLVTHIFPNICSTCYSFSGCIWVQYWTNTGFT